MEFWNAQAKAHSGEFRAVLRPHPWPPRQLMTKGEVKAETKSDGNEQ